ncbi:G3P acyltransferase [Piscirickettsia salmonis]|uniref:glycerol-3-phosphate 1-O-acyltransferase PlsY n=1 Tax=Piscirickettsia salmonis TaxID=1238 RepID=UPI0012BAAE7C|nr:glycerol-3-phosphate 1-O-acyltransferase PlsY [Piscirickettsia salmonis]QGP55338.1 G3P acyltransferase [Piscirickettsia salmonis]QGP58802.1 G3P acyltransferase [Piscirickettsia salmonis]QGP64904.1 G3P acyltransferase [Piscirickettsia salmonis]
MFIGIALVIFAYLLGSISTGIVTCKLMGLPDPRSDGSGNPGATNVLRVGGKKAAIITLVGDALKGIIPVALAHALNQHTLLGHTLQLTEAGLGIIAFAAFFGHLYPIFFKFQGGKGVATGFGAVIALSWPLGLTLLITWLIMAFLFRISSLAALTASVLAPLYSYWLGTEGYIMPLIIMAIFTLYRHKANIVRLIHGAEPKIGQKKSAP